MRDKILIAALVIALALTIAFSFLLQLKKSNIVISTKTETVTNYVTNLAYITNAPKGCNDIAARYNALVDERRLYLDTPSLIYASNDYVYVSNSWRVERAAVRVHNKSAVHLGVGVSYPLGVVATVRYSPVPVQVGAIVHIDRASFFAQYVIRFGGDE